MPLYDYECGDCDTTFEELVKNTKQVVKCPGCGKLMSDDNKLPTYAPNFKVVGGEVSRHKQKYGRTGYTDKKKHLDPQSDNGVKFNVVPKRKL